MKAKVDNDDSAQLMQQNQIMTCIASCKEKHGGPVISTDDLKSLVQNWKGSEKNLHKSLNLEIRLRRLTFTNVKASCPLFCQKGLTIDQKVKNIGSLLTTQLEMSVEATMDDLEEAIVECSSPIQVEQQEDCRLQLQPVEPGHSDLNDDSLSPMPNVGECIVALFTDGAFPGEVTSVDGDYLEADFYVKAKVSQMGKNSSLWKRPSRERIIIFTRIECYQ